MGTVKYTGPVASFHCPTEATIRSLKVHFSPKQEGAGDPSPENVREIEGWDGVEVYKTSKNLININNDSYSCPFSSGVSGGTIPSDFKFEDGEFSGTVPQGTRDLSVFTSNRAYPPGTYTLSYDYENNAINSNWRPILIAVGNKSNNWYSAATNCAYYGLSGKGHFTKTFTAVTPVYFNLSLNNYGNAETTAKNRIYNIKLELGSIATPYEPYHGSTTNYEFGVLGKNKFPLRATNQFLNTSTGWPNTNARDMTTGDVFVNISSNNYWSGRSNNVYGISIGDSSVSYHAINSSYGIGVFVPVSPNTEYTLSHAETVAMSRIGYYDSEGNYLNVNFSFTGTSRTFTTIADTAYILVVFATDSANTEGDYTVSNIQLELGSTATAYEPYDPNKTVYGGWVDLISGEVCEEYEKKVLDGSENWALNAWSKNGVYLSNRENFNNRIIPYQGSTADKIYCNMLGSINTTYYLKTDKAFTIVGGDYVPNYTYLLLYNSEWGQTVEEYKAALKALYDNGTPIEVVAPLKTDFQQTYYLPPHPSTLKTFLSHNNIWSNADYVEVEYDLHETQDILARKQFIIANQPHLEEVSNSMITFNTDLKAPLKECKIYFNPIQEGSGDPSPDNVRPITGWTGLSLYHSEGNLYTPNSNNKGYISSSGVINVDTTSTYTDLIPVVVGDTYTFRCTTASVNGNTNRRIHGYDNSGNWVKQLAVGTTAANIIEERKILATIPSGISYIRISFRN